MVLKLKEAMIRNEALNQSNVIYFHKKVS